MRYCECRHPEVGHAPDFHGRHTLFCGNQPSPNHGRCPCLMFDAVTCVFCNEDMRPSGDGWHCEGCQP